MELSSLLKRFANSSRRHYKDLLQLKSCHPFPKDKLQEGYSNFYHKDTIQPWAAVYAKGPWITTNSNKVVYDTGGYGMLGLGHNPDSILSALSKEQVMANIMTPNKVHETFWHGIKGELKSYEKIVCLNSGSEVNSYAMRIANIHDHPNPVRISMKGSFHGRTDKPAQVSNSSLSKYQKYLSDYSKPMNNYTIEVNNCTHAKEIFETIKQRGEFPEITLIEPVQGEGNPGVQLSPEFYSTLRQLTKDAGGLLLADSVQSGWRCTGQLSITNYPHFSNLDPPDMETFSKAIHAGQFPLSVLAINKTLADNFAFGLYGNTMTANPRALEVGAAVQGEMNEYIRDNIRSQGMYFLKELGVLANKYDCLTHATGKGLLLALHLEKNCPVLLVERELRKRGLNVIHGGENALRFTPWFYISKEEIDFIMEMLDKVFAERK